MQISRQMRMNCYIWRRGGARAGFESPFYCYAPHCYNCTVTAFGQRTEHYHRIDCRGEGGNGEII